MAHRIDNHYSRFVAWTKIILPLMALAILSSLFLFSKSNDPSGGIHLSDADLTEFASKERITKPRFAGMTPDGITLELSADEASPRSNGEPAFDATDLLAKVVFPGGETVDITAKLGSVDSLKKQARLEGGIVLKTSGGYTATTQGLTFALEQVDIESLGEIRAVGPLGDIFAGGLHLVTQIDTSPDGAPGYLIKFKNGVKLIYKP